MPPRSQVVSSGKHSMGLTMQINWGLVEQWLIDAGKEGVQNTLNRMNQEALEKVPVRSAFYGESRRKTSTVMVGGRSLSGEIARSFRGERRMPQFNYFDQRYKLPEVRTKRREYVGQKVLTPDRDRERRLVQAYVMRRESAPDNTIRAVKQPVAPHVLTYTYGRKGEQKLHEPERPRRSNEPPIEYELASDHWHGLLHARGRYDIRMGRGLHARVRGEAAEVEYGGTLRDSIEIIGPDVRGNKVTGRLQAGGGEAYYAIYQELGTSHNKAQPFLRPAIDMAAAGMFAKMVKNSVANAGRSSITGVRK